MPDAKEPQHAASCVRPWEMPHDLQHVLYPGAESRPHLKEHGCRTGEPRPPPQMRSCCRPLERPHPLQHVLYPVAEARPHLFTQSCCCCCVVGGGVVAPPASHRGALPHVTTPAFPGGCVGGSVVAPPASSRGLLPLTTPPASPGGCVRGSVVAPPALPVGSLQLATPPASPRGSLPLTTPPTFPGGSLPLAYSSPCAVCNSAPMRRGWMSHVCTPKLGPKFVLQSCFLLQNIILPECIPRLRPRGECEKGRASEEEEIAKPPGSRKSLGTGEAPGGAKCARRQGFASSI